jgi:hypothetical protein
MLTLLPKQLVYEANLMESSGLNEASEFLRLPVPHHLQFLLENNIIYPQIVRLGLCVTEMISLDLRLPRQLTPGHVSATSLTLQPLRPLSSSSSKSLASALSPNSHIALSVQAVRSPALFSSTPVSLHCHLHQLLYLPGIATFLPKNR